MSNGTFFLLLLIAFLGTFSFILMKADPIDGATPVCDHGFTYIEEVDVCASNDYYSVDGVRLPLSMPEIRQLQRDNDFRLPTQQEVDAIWRAAVVKLPPVPFTRYDIMTTYAEFVRHDSVIDQQLEDRGVVGGELVAGHKKDVIQPRRSGRVTIYGWHRLNGRPIQPVTSVHADTYRDYSHGVRLIKEVNDR